MNHRFRARETVMDASPTEAPAPHDAPATAPPRRHHDPDDLADRVALAATRLLRGMADLFFVKRYGHRAIVLETVAAVPGMVGATLTHLRCLRRMVGDQGWIRVLLEEAENERMHLMTFIEIARPTALERLVVALAQWIFYVGYFVLYLMSSRTAHRLVGYFEEEAVLSYTLYLEEVDAGRMPNPPAPALAKQYWLLPDDAMLRDVLLVIRADEAHHRDVNHALASELAGRPASRTPQATYPGHAEGTKTTGTSGG
jgi:ubiquinol oxidase